MARERICGIYRIENLINHQSYVGQAIDIYDRWVQHKWELNTGRHHNKHLLRAWNKYGCENFEFTIIEECPRVDLNSREIYWIEYYDSFNNGYNQTKGGDGCLGKIYTDEEREKLGNPILQIDYNGNVVKRWPTIVCAAEVLNINKRQIWNCANRHIGYSVHNGKKYDRSTKSVGGYIWVYEKDFNNFNLLWYEDERIRRVTYQYDLNWNIIKIWETTEAVKAIGYDPTVVRRVCNGEFIKAYNSLWSYEIDNLDEYIEWFKDHFDVKYIGCYTLSGELIKVYNNPAETEADGFRAGSVREVLNGHQIKHKGCTFEYIPWKEVEKINWKGQLNYGR